MRYASIRKTDVSNGLGIGISLFVQGCHFHCYNCFNQCTWDFNGGKEWNNDIKEKFLSLLKKDHIQRVSILGGEPLADENVSDIYSLIYDIRDKYPNKKIWMFSGYRFDDIMYEGLHIYSDNYEDNSNNKIISARLYSTLMLDVLVDGLYIDKLRDMKLKWKGSSNQRVINIKETYKKYNLRLSEDIKCCPDSVRELINSSIVELE